jgi:hypothetical protein
VRADRHTGKQTVGLIIDAHYASLDVHPTTTLIELPDTDYAHLKTHNEIHFGQCAMLTSLAHEDDGVVPFDLHDGAIAQGHRPADVGVKLKEGIPRPGHVVHSTDVEDPTSVVAFLR